MRSLSCYILESLTSNKIVDLYMHNLDLLSPMRKQHFLSRLALCDLEESKNLSTSTNIDNIIKIINDILDYLKEEDYDKIISKYVVVPYKGISKEKDKIYDWLCDLDSQQAKRYFALGFLFDRLYIIERTNNVDKIDRWDDIYNICDDLDDMIKFHNEDPMDCKNMNGTLYVNFIGNAYYVTNSNKLNFKKKVNIVDWRKTRKLFTSMKDCNAISLYGITHSIINGSRFYTTYLDIEEFKEELTYLDAFLKDMYKNQYKLDNDLTIDLLCECAFCERLANSSKYKEWKHVLEHMNTLVDSSTHIIQSNSRYKDDKKKNLENNEHCNVLYILLNSYKMPKK